jgi:cell division protein FtsI (penicillin-binding protein 3)
VAEWLEGVVADPDGTGKRARLPGWRVAGKTGTAQKADPVSGGYSADKHFSSFVGFAPADAPRVAIGIFIDEPKGEIYGGEVAAPVFRDVAEHAMKSRGVPQSGTAVAALAPPAPSGATEPFPEREEIAPVPPVEFAPRRPSQGTGAVAVPALQGLAARSALRRLETADLAGDLRGTGRVTGQVPRAGELVERGTRIRLTLAPPG